MDLIDEDRRRTKAIGLALDAASRSEAPLIEETFELALDDLGYSVVPDGQARVNGSEWWLQPPDHFRANPELLAETDRPDLLFRLVST